METLHKHFRELTREAFARHGFAQAELVANWNEIVGPEIAAISAPENLRAPRGAGAARQGAVLHLRTAPGRALDVSYAGPRIIERVNAFLGFGAVAQIKAIAAARWRESPQAFPPPPESFADEQSLAAISDEALKTSLHRLGAAVAAHARGSPQGK
jgi:hypothetical protein